MAELNEVALQLPDEQALAAALGELGLEGPLVAANGAPLRFSIDHRRSQDEHIVLVFNESWSTTRQTVRLNVGSGAILRWDPDEEHPENVNADAKGSLPFELELEPAESIVLTVGF